MTAELELESVCAPTVMFTSAPLELLLRAWSIQRERGDSVGDYVQNPVEAQQIVAERPS
jgi:hypothetical protein